MLLVAALGLLVFAMSAPLWWRYGPADLRFVHSIGIAASLIVGAQRLQTWAAPGQTVISSETHDQIDSGMTVVQLPTATVKGRRAPVTAFRVGMA